MIDWPNCPSIYEINTWVWLHELRQRYRRDITLGNVPPHEWDTLAGYKFDAVWLMGVWERSAAARNIAREYPQWQGEYRRALPDLQPQDVAGSPYSVRRYVVDGHLGGPEGLAAAREALATRGMRLLLDFVSNHVAPDHPWITEHPEYLIQGHSDDLERAPDAFFLRQGAVSLPVVAMRTSPPGRIRPNSIPSILDCAHLPSKRSKPSRSRAMACAAICPCCS
ncbi:MAG: alpha-amylase family glycosyl hydrolase [Candidatus Entotheonellia bacterium]